MRPSWLTAGALRFGLLCCFILAFEMLPWRLGPRSAGVVSFAGLAGLAALAVLFFGLARRLAAHLHFLPGPQRSLEAFLLLLRRIGLPLLGLGFFLFWTFVYMGLWWYHPRGAFTGLGPAPRFADFFFYAVSTSFIEPPVDIVAHTRGARAATMIELLTALALLTVYLSSFIDWGRVMEGADVEKEAAPPDADHHLI